MQSSAIAGATTPQLSLSVDAGKKSQAIRGWGGCFNEKGWAALETISEPDRQSVIKALFDPKDGCKFDLCRTPSGASDYAMDKSWYSLDDTAGDYAMEHFSTDRDRQRLIPFIKAAMRECPDLQLWASPWTPPVWLSRIMDAKGEPYGNPDAENGDPTAEYFSVKDGKVHLKQDEKSFTAYGLYFAKYVQAYQQEGLHLFAVVPQNEPCWDNWHPGFPMNCGFTCDEYYNWVSHLVAAFQQYDIHCDIWLGTFLDQDKGLHITPEYVGRIVANPDLAPYIKGVGCQYGLKQMKDIHTLYPELELMETETPCGNGSNDWDYGDAQFSCVRNYLQAGAFSYLLWNMILDETGCSAGAWKQSAPVTIDRRSHTVIYNPQFYAYRHYSYYIEQGAHRVESPGSCKDQISFANPDGTIVVVVQNSTNTPESLSMTVDGVTCYPTLPARSWNTFTVSGTK